MYRRSRDTRRTIPPPSLDRRSDVAATSRQQSRDAWWGLRYRCRESGVVRASLRPVVRRLLAVPLLLALAAGGVTTTARADSSGDPGSAVDAAKQQLAQAQAKAAALKAKADADAQQLAADQAALTALQQRLAALAAEVIRDQATVDTLRTQIAEDRGRCRRSSARAMRAAGRRRWCSTSSAPPTSPG